ncbi:MAG: primosomal protein N', partial [Glaciihabitans sp.]
MGTASIARVLVDSPLPQLDRLFDYRVPDALKDDAVPGVRVRVPLRSAGRIADGYIVELVEEGDYTGVLSDLEAVVSPIRVLTPEVATLARKAADRAAGSATDIVRLAVPGRQVRVEKTWLAAADRAELPPVTAASIDGYGADQLEAVIRGGHRAAVDAIPLVTEAASDVWVGNWAVTMAAAAAVSLAAGKTAILAVPDYRDQEQLMAALAAVLPPERI